MTTLKTLAADWRDDAANPEIDLSDDHRAALIACADELDKRWVKFREGPHFANKGDAEARFIEDGDRLDCPACGGSGHAHDAST